MVGAGNTCWRDDKCRKHLDRKTRREYNIKVVLKKWNVMMWTGFIWLNGVQ